MEKKYLVIYENLLSHLFMMDENIGLDENDLDKKYELRHRLYSVTKCGNIQRQHFNLPFGSYYIDQLIITDDTFISDYSHNEWFTLGVELDEDLIQSLNIPTTSILEVTELQNGFYVRNLENLYVMKELSELEIDSLDEDTKKAYEKNISDIKYYFGKGSSVAISLEIEHDEDNTRDHYYVIDGDYPDCLDSIVTYLQATPSGNYIIKEKPPKSKKGFIKILTEKIMKKD